MAEYFVGIDIGSTCAKTVVMGRERQILHRFLQPTGWSSADTAEAIRKQLAEAGIGRGDGEPSGLDNARIVATGYGRISVPYADKCITEITCHGKGACYIHGTQDVTVIDIGGQDTKVIQVEQGAVADFIMNDKCSAGTGRFLEIMSNTLGLRTEELCRLAGKGGNITISSMCTVFAESEVVSLIGRGETRENIAYAVVNSIVDKVVSQVGRMQREHAAFCLTGGLCGFPYVNMRLSQELGMPVMTEEDGRYAGAVGAALCAVELEMRGRRRGGSIE